MKKATNGYQTERGVVEIKNGLRKMKLASTIKIKICENKMR